MNKVFIVARTEYLISVTSKAFLIGIVMMPIFMGGAILVQYLTHDQIDIAPRRIALVDQTGRLFDKLQTRAEIHNQTEIFDGEGEQRKQTGAPFILENYIPEDHGDERADVVLTRRVSDGDLFAFAIIDDGIFEATSAGSIRYHSQTPSYQTLANWLRNAVNEEIKSVRIAELQLSNETVAALSRHAPLRQFGLVETDIQGGVQDAKEENRILTFAIPFAGLMLMFMMIMSVAPAMLNNVLEEKIQKISEFLISSVTPFQLMAGKLLGAVCVGLTLSTLYLGAAFGLAVYFDVSDSVPVSLYAWFVFYLLVSLVTFGSIFSAIGAACSEIRDAQSLMTPVMLLVIIPMMCIGPILDSPSSTFSRAISLFPPATPMLMFVRIAIPPGPAVWEIVLGSVLTVLFAIGCVWAAGKVFRIGILSQGQSPSIAKLATWVLAK
ncbi:ABC-2 family transporter protein [Planctomycetes bacterium CA13]|uniref:ABC-2 family transporter protein n=1 Tax=Novipirellula herctigrandis TaxID=2527986 RepID=A0A5C5ZA19_9BACT|nr:ABC-2 family transporter protein [Planctomycetes bacterium CA13]